ncbi:hypothetical protein N7325_20140 [Stutzerimonas stutzeri]|uniref:hypothetical protein n=1 Tax=Stutzerimonas stutzeri TaxID=316 RepID=UPI002448691D|nr:hypothetical protein [Stutzerimonas stutzeri]MDH0122124.1 hypothetical protein [Stutzerimonas stutzeri]
MPLNIKAFERAMKKAAEEKKAALTVPAPAPVTAKAPKKEEQPELKSNLTPEEIQYYVNMIHEANARSPSHPNNTTNRIIRERLELMGLQPND